MDLARQFLLDAGYSTKEIHGAKPQDKIKLIAKTYGFKSAEIPRITKKAAQGFLKEFFALEHKNNESFYMLFQRLLDKHLIKYMPKNSEHKIVIGNIPSNKFYQSSEWQSLRYQVLEKYGNKCFACGRSPHQHGVVIHVDHILPRSTYPEHALTFGNMQVLCEDCNLGKSNKYETSWKR